MAISLKSIGSKIKSTASKVASAVKKVVTGGGQSASVASSVVSKSTPKIGLDPKAPAASKNVGVGSSTSVATGKTTSSSGLNSALNTRTNVSSKSSSGLGSNIKSTVSGGAYKGSSLSSLSRSGDLMSSSPSSVSSSIFSSPSMGDISSVTTAPRLPSAPSPTNFTGLTNAYTTAAGLTDATGATVPPPVTPAEDPNAKIQQDLIKQLKREEPDRIDREAIMEQSGYNQAQKEANDIKNRINSISAQAQANILQLRGTAAQEGVTEAVYGGQQAQIERETAIKLMPLTAQYEAAVGNLEAAKEIVNNFIADENKYQDRVQAWKNDIYDKVWSIATTAQKTAIEDRRIKEANQREDERKFLEQQGEYINTAIANGQGYLINGILGATNYDELFSQAAKIVKPKESKAPDVKTINGVDMQWNPSTGNWETITTSASGSQTKASVDQIKFLRDTIKEAKELAPASGKGIWDRISGWATGSSKYNQLEAKTNTLRTNVLTLMTDPSVKKYFGPQMSEADVRLMTAAGTTLNPEFNTPAQLIAEADRLDELLNRMETAVRIGATGGNIITAPDGKVIELTD